MFKVAVLEKYVLAFLEEKGIFHGSPLKFKAFTGTGNQGRNYGHGHYFTEKKEEAREYALRSDSDGYIYTVDLHAHKPYNPRDPEHAKKLGKILGLKWDSIKKDKTYEDPMTGADKTDFDNYYMKLANTLIKKLLSDNDSYTKVDLMLGNALKQAGFDSVYDPVKKWWVVPDPSQVKIRRTEKVKFYGYDKDGNLKKGKHA